MSSTYFIYYYFDYERTLWRLFQKRAVRHKFDIYVFIYYHHWADTSVGGLLVPECIIQPVVSVSALTWFIGYIYHWNYSS